MSTGHGLVGLRPLPRNDADRQHNHGGPWTGMPTFEEQKGKYPFVAERLDVVMGWQGGDFKTKLGFFEYYWGLSEAGDSLVPEASPLVREIRAWEARGGQIEHILICREYDLAIHRGYRDAKPGPFKEDTRILFAQDVDNIRGLFRAAHAKGLLKHDNYKLIQMVQHPTFFADDPRVHPILAKMEGIAYEAHQFNRHWPLETGWSSPGKVVHGAKWTLEQGKEYIFYYGPIIWKSPQYYPFIERDWLKAYWKAGLPKHHPRMHYYLNTFPNEHGRGRPVGPETDPHSVLGLTRWLIEEIQGGPGPGATIGAYYFDGWAGRSDRSGDPKEPWARNAPTHLSRRLVEEFPQREPVWGWRDDSLEVMERQIALAADHGLGFFSFCWYWHDDARALNAKAIKEDPKHTSLDLFVHAKNNHRMKFCLLVANHAGYEIKGPANWKAAVEAWLPYLKHKQHLTVGGRPLVIVFAPAGLDKESLAAMQEAARKAGLPGLAIAGCGGGAASAGFTHRTHYCVAAGGASGSAEHKYAELVAANEAQWKGSPEQPYIPIVTAGWDKRPWEGPRGLYNGQAGWYYPDRTPGQFANFLRDAVGWMDAHPEQATAERLVLIYAWNEFGEGGYIAPTKGDPDGEYLKALRSVAASEPQSRPGSPSPERGPKRADRWSVASPDKKIVVTVHRTAGQLSYSVEREGVRVIEESPLGVTMEGAGGDFVRGLEFRSAQTSAVDETYTLPTGKKRVYVNRGNELAITLANGAGQPMVVAFRAYDDGIAYRYSFPGSGQGRTIVSESSGFRVPARSRGWGQPWSKSENHESEYTTGTVGGDFFASGELWFPVLFELPRGRSWVLLTEAAVYGDFCASRLQYDAGCFRVRHNRTDGVEDKVTGTLPWSTPWRVAVIGETPAAIVETNLCENLNPPTEIGDMSWIRPGRTSWTWWYGATDRRPFDEFAAGEMGWEYGCGRGEMWYDWVGVFARCVGAEGDRVRLAKSGSLAEALDQELAKKAASGVVTLKCDFMDSDGQERMKDYDLIARTCAKHKIMLNWHGSRLPGGERRRWPHMVGYEGVYGAEWYKMAHGPSVFHRLCLPFTRNVVGPMDFTGVTFTGPARGKRDNSDAAELALAVLYENGISYWGDHPDAYRSRPAAMSFLKKCPSAWEQTRFVAGYPGEFVCLARKGLGSETWFIGGMSAQPARDVSIPLRFLTPGREYRLTLHRDGADGTRIETQTLAVNASTVLTVGLLKHGGFAGTIE